MKELFEIKNNFARYAHVPSELVIGKIPSNKPLVSIIIPAYNHPDYLEHAIESCISQKCSFDYEIIVVDNNNPEYQRQNREIIESHIVDNLRYYVNSENIGGVGNENRGIELAKGEFITLCHDDDMLYDTALDTLVKYYDLINAKGAVIFGNYDKVDGNGDKINYENEFDSIILKSRKYYKVLINDFLYQNYTNGCGSLYRKDNLITIGGYCEDHIPCPDYAMNALYTHLYGGFAINKRTLKYRVSEQSDTSNAFRYIVEENKLITDSIIGLGGIWRKINKPFVTLSLSVSNYHLYKAWDKKNKGGRHYFVARTINRLRIYVTWFAHRLRSF